jgi:hypothetical protein
MASPTAGSSGFEMSRIGSSIEVSAGVGAILDSVVIFSEFQW